MTRPLSPLVGFTLIASALAAAAAGLYGSPTVGERGALPPTVQVLSPNGGETLPSGQAITITWLADDDSGFVAGAQVEVSFDGGVTWDRLTRRQFNTSDFTWFPQNRPTVQGLIRVTVWDSWDQSAADTSDTPFTITNGAVGRLPTTLRDFDLPGTQPLDVDILTIPDGCVGCHSDFDPAVEPFFNWQGSMMAHASIDPIFLAAFDVAKKDAPESTDLCLRCHISHAWLDGRSNPTDGSQLRPTDRFGVSCALCHRMVDPFFKPGISPDIDADILQALRHAPTELGDGQYVIDPDDQRRRGPFDDAFLAPHDWVPSPFHRDSALCGTCHEVSNPQIVRRPDGTYGPDAFDTPATAVGPHDLFPEQRTYSEWFFSAFNTPQGVFAPEFGGNRLYVSSCQHCHMRATTGPACSFFEAPTRELGLHDLTGGNTWVLSLIPQIDPNVNPAAIQAGIARSRYMLQNAATLDLSHGDAALNVKVTNKTGHKLPTGYPEGRRMWLNVRFFDRNDQLIGESGAYDPNSAELTIDPAIKIYQMRAVVSAEVGQASGVPAGTEFHLVLNSEIVKDNRIPPLGWSPAGYEWFGGQPVGAPYIGGQNWDTTAYAIPVGAVRADVALYYQTTTREYVEFLRDEGIPGGAGDQLYTLWMNNEKAPPELMRAASIAVPTQIKGDLNCDGLVNFSDIDAFVLALGGEAGYVAEYPNCDISQADIDADSAVTFGDIDPFVALFNVR